MRCFLTLVEVVCVCVDGCGVCDGWMGVDDEVEGVPVVVWVWGGIWNPPCTQGSRGTLGAFLEGPIALPLVPPLGSSGAKDPGLFYHPETGPECVLAAILWQSPATLLPF